MNGWYGRARSAARYGTRALCSALIRGARRDARDVASGRRRDLDSVLATVIHACVATTPREGDESPLSLFGDDEASALELDASTLSPATATAETETEWVRFDGDDGEDDDDARRAMEASDASLTRPLLRSSSSSGYVEAYGASAESPTLEDRSEARAASYGAAEDAIENSPQMVVELDAVEEAASQYGASGAFWGGQGIGKQWSMRREMRTPRYTTCWQEIPKVC